MRRAEKVKRILADLESLGKLFSLSARDLGKLHEETGGLKEHLEVLEEILERARALHGDLYALEARPKRPYEDNSAKTLRELFL